MWFEDKVSPEFASKVKAFSARLGMVPDFVMTVMSFETVDTFSPSIKNPSSTATGLIQFMAATAAAMGTSCAALAAMSAVDQLDYVERYFKSQIASYGPLTTLEDTYFAVFYPAAIKQPLTYTFSPSVYAVNKVFDLDKSGTMTKKEVSDTLYNYVKKKGMNLPLKPKLCKTSPSTSQELDCLPRLDC
jgi:hypothetical protein